MALVKNFIQIIKNYTIQEFNYIICQHNLHNLYNEN